MKLKMMTSEGPAIIETDSISQFYSDFSSGGRFTKLDLIGDDGVISKITVKHDFYQVTQALAKVWEMETKDGSHE